MNVLKALAKMTKLAACLETENVDLRRDVEVSQKRELSIGDQVAVQREKIQSLEAKLYAAEQNATSRMHFDAVLKLNDLGHCWDTTRDVWVDPVPLPPTAATPVLVDVVPETNAPWPSKPRGLGWRNNSMVATPRDMSDRVEALLLNGTRTSKPASEFEWNTGMSTGVAWWRFDLPNRDDVEPAK